MYNLKNLTKEELSKEYLKLQGNLNSINYRIGTNGERGLHRERKSLIVKIRKIKEQYNKTIKQ